MESILKSVRLLVGSDEDFEAFDKELVIYTNTALNVLAQLGVGPSGGFFITDTEALWTDFLPFNDPRFELVKAYVLQKVRILFDPPTSSAVLESMNRTLAELEWRIMIVVETV